MAVFRNGGFRGVSEATEKLRLPKRPKSDSDRKAKRPKSEATEKRSDRKAKRPKRSDKFTTEANR